MYVCVCVLCRSQTGTCKKFKRLRDIYDIVVFDQCLSTKIISQMTTIFQKRLGWSTNFFQSCKWWYRDHYITKPIDLHCLNPQKRVILTIPHCWWFRNQVNSPVHVGIVYPHRYSFIPYIHRVLPPSPVVLGAWISEPTNPSNGPWRLQTLQGFTQFPLQGPPPGTEPGAPGPRKKWPKINGQLTGVKPPYKLGVEKNPFKKNEWPFLANE